MKGKGRVGIAGWALRKVAAGAQHKFEMLRTVPLRTRMLSKVLLLSRIIPHSSIDSERCYVICSKIDFIPLLLPPSSLSPLRHHDDDEGR